MLENRLNALAVTMRIILWVGIPLWMLFTAWISSGQSNEGTWWIIGMIFGVAVICYLYYRYKIEYRVCEAYLFALQSRDFQQALSYGRSYYGLRRFGLQGAAGSSLLAVDEQAINNDIIAYSR